MKGIDTVNKQALYSIFRKQGYPEKFTGYIIPLPDNMKTWVYVNGELLNSTLIENGVKQGDHLAPPLFAILSTIVLLLLEIMLVFISASEHLKTFSTYSRHIQRLECFCRNTFIRYWKYRDEEYSIKKLTSIESIVLKWRLRLTAHLVSLEDSQLKNKRCMVNWYKANVHRANHTNATNTASRMESIGTDAWEDLTPQILLGIHYWQLVLTNWRKVELNIFAPWRM